MKTPEESVPDYVKACDALRRQAYLWEKLAVEYEHMAVLGEQDAAYMDQPIPAAALPVVASVFRNAAKDTHDYLDWTPCADPDGPVA